MRCWRGSASFRATRPSGSAARISLGVRFEFAQARHDALLVLGPARGPPKQKSMPVAKRPPAGRAVYM